MSQFLCGWARGVATMVHAKDVDKAGKPYLGHLERVAGHIMRMAPGDDILVAAAWLHDVREDHPEAWPTIVAQLDRVGDIGEGEALNWITLALTRQGGETYRHYIERVCEHRDSAIIKLADLEDNMAADRDFPGRESLLVRYREAFNAIRTSAKLGEFVSGEFPVTG